MGFILDQHTWSCFQLRQVKKKDAEKLIKQMYSSKVRNYIGFSTDEIHRFPSIFYLLAS